MGDKEEDLDQADEQVLARALDPDGRQVVLRREEWEHALAGHPELARLRHQVMRAVSSPDHRTDDERPGRERFYLRTSSPSRWLRVVVDFVGAEAFVVTAFAQRGDPPGWSMSTK